MSHGIRPPGKWNEACVNKKTFTSPEVLKADKIFRLQGVYGIGSAYIIAYLPEINIPFKSNSVAWNSTHRIKCSIYDKYMQNHAMLEPIDKHILLLEYSSPSHTEEILMSFLDYN